MRINTDSFAKNGDFFLHEKNGVIEAEEITLLAKIKAWISKYFSAVFFGDYNLATLRKKIVFSNVDLTSPIIEKINTVFAKKNLQVKPGSADLDIVLKEVSNKGKTPTKSVEAMKAWLKTQNLVEGSAGAKMAVNFFKAIAEHDAIESVSSLDLRFNPNKEAVSITTSQAEAQGIRDAMQDDHFVINKDNYCIAGIFDGHGGAEVALDANQRFREELDKELGKLQNEERTPEKIKQILMGVHDDVQKSILKRGEEQGRVDKNSAEKTEFIKNMGTTALITVVDKFHKRVYTMTLGDSEAKMYAKNQEKETISVPLSVVRRPTSEKDLAHVKKAGGLVICDRIDGCLAVSRALGNEIRKGVRTKQDLIYRKPKVTMAPLLPDSLIVLACDGVWDFRMATYHGKETTVEKNFVDSTLKRRFLWGKTRAEVIRDDTLNNHKALKYWGDNVTVITLDIGSFSVNV